MILGIDASNIRAGGGVTHLVELLDASEPSNYGFEKVIIWGSDATLNKIPRHPLLAKKNPPVLNKSLLHRMFWQRFRLSRLAHYENCTLLLTPGGSYAGNFHPVVTMSQNLLPFEWKEARRYGLSLRAIKMIMLRIIQSRTFRKADGIIFLTKYARQTVSRIVRVPQEKTVIIPHGINERFFKGPSKQLPIAAFSDENPFRLLYVSIIDMYKHQWNVAESVMLLRKKGIPVVLDLVGPAYGQALRKLKEKLAEIDPAGAYVHYHGAIPYEELHRFHSCCHLYVFASSCENMPNILMEGMAAGLPIACSNLGPMPEVLGDAGIYFNPLDVSSITEALQTMILSDKMRTEKSNLSFYKAAEYSWAECARRTFEFLQKTALAYKRKINN